MPSRSSVIAMLVAAEIGIVGVALYGLGGKSPGRFFAGSGSAIGPDFAAKSFLPMAAGSAPHVTIDDPNSGVTISASADGLVHVKDDTYFSGATLRRPNDYPQLTVRQDFSGVHISRPAYHADWRTFLGFSNSHQHFEVQVPAGASVAVTSCDNAEVSDIKGGLTINALDGRIELNRIEGTVVAHSDDGHIAANYVTSPSVDLSSADGWVELHNFTATGNGPSVRLHSDDGHVYAGGMFPSGGKYDVGTNDGRVKVMFTRGSDVMVDASTNDGNVTVDGTRSDGDDGAQQSVRVGNGSSAMRVHSDDGSITISTNGSE